MTLKKTITVEQSGAPASIHRIVSVTINYEGNSTSAQISSFYDDAARRANRTPLANSSLSVEGVPKAGKDPKAYVEAALVAPVPEGEDGDATLKVYAPNRYAFSGAEIIAD
ncbi:MULTISPECIES: hypothetical protein [Burkholderia]|uniref:hypothetical protein n=1 Tax=Burkholderia TaxID=32008 RepID=UPI000847A644|nr:MULTISPECIES: hypothetical protein [Burkholderia]MCW3642838.1 hypothetical protein [Burkholderia cenocepacia]MDR5644035.1 hypothetical protein [Burkholderia cenocepacia]QUN53120.1 hypothetical protein KEH58_09775 [Burkholderia cenocepacia]RQU50781.1 hypothetical protein DF143_35495 [Burkholderia cenocepacia]RQV33133.1 hypothetical protein DF033_35070 [Burkholderia cenocepacia]